jgi:hypothetical protein
MLLGTQVLWIARVEIHLLRYAAAAPKLFTKIELLKILLELIDVVGK